jgi:FtsH-binding integral membrane protein
MALTVTTPALFNPVYGNSLVLILLIVAQLALVIAISAAISRLTAATATALFLLYAALNGVTLSSLLLTYTGASITQKLKRLLAQNPEGETAGRIVVVGALTLYLDFINLFLNLLRIFGRRR